MRTLSPDLAFNGSIPPRRINCNNIITRGLPASTALPETRQVLISSKFIYPHPDRAVEKRLLPSLPLGPNVEERRLPSLPIGCSGWVQVCVDVAVILIPGLLENRPGI